MSPRPLSNEEDSLLRFLLAPWAQAEAQILRDQIDSLQVIDDEPPEDPTIIFEVAPGTRRADDLDGCVVLAVTPDLVNAQVLVRNGFLYALDVYADDPTMKTVRLPSPDELQFVLPDETRWRPD